MKSSQLSSSSSDCDRRYEERGSPRLVLLARESVRNSVSGEEGGSGSIQAPARDLCGAARIASGLLAPGQLKRVASPRTNSPGVAGRNVWNED